MSSLDIFAEPLRGQKIEKHAVTDFSLTNGAVTEEHQEASWKSTIDEVPGAKTGGNDIGLWSASIPEKIRNTG